MRPGLWHKLDLWARNSVPFLAALAMVVIGLVRWPLPGAAPVAPVLALVAVHYWTVHRPELMPPAAVFALGLLQDILGGAPIGLNALVLLVVHGVLLMQRQHLARRPFIVDWWGFAVVAAGAGLLGWLVASLYYGGTIWPKPLLVQYLLNLCAYPVLAWVFTRAQLLLFRTA